MSPYSLAPLPLFPDDGHGVSRFVPRSVKESNKFRHGESTAILIPLCGSHGSTNGRVSLVLDIPVSAKTIQPAGNAVELDIPEAPYLSARSLCLSGKIAARCDEILVDHSARYVPT